MTFLTMILLLSSCKKENDTLTPKPSTNIYGIAILKNGNDNASNSNGITVAVEETSISANTDSTGNFKLENVEYGEKCFVYSKPGYGVYKLYKSVNETSSSYINGILLFKLPSNKVSNISMQFVNDSLIVVGTVSTYEPFCRGVILFFSKDSMISSDPKQHIFSLNEYNTPLESLNFSIPIPKSVLTSKGINTGEKLYVVAYTAVIYSSTNREYLDKKSGKILYNGISLEPSKVVGIQFP